MMINPVLTVKGLLARRNSRYLFLFSTGYFAAIVQIIFLRECLAIFSGNELIVGLVIAVWLGAGALGSRTGCRVKTIESCYIALFCIFSLMAGLIMLRAVPLLFNPGESVSPPLISIILLVTEFPGSFFAGFAFGIQSRVADGKRLYLWENSGSLAGLIIVSAGILLGVPNGYLAAIAAFPLLLHAIPDKYCFVMGISFLVIAVLMDSRSRTWKYVLDVSKVVYGNESEIAFSKSEGLDLVLKNNTIHYTDLSFPLLEQAVHIPLSVRNNYNRVLVINDIGHVRELEKYDNLETVCTRSEPVLAKKSNCFTKLSGDFIGTESYDVIILGNDIPQTVSQNRYFTEMFFKKVKTSLTGDSAVFSFTLNFNSSYLNNYEKKIRDVMFLTLKKVFNNVKIFPGHGYTFLASDALFELPDTCLVKTDYLHGYIFPDLTIQKIEIANNVSDKVKCNTVNKPVILSLSLKRYLKQYNVQIKAAVSILVIVSLFVVIMFLGTRSGVSVGTTGFSVAVYSLMILLLYQSVYGNLYSRISILMIGLSAGFILGSYIKTFPYSDFITGVYLLVTPYLIIKSTYMPFSGFFLMHMGAGILSGAQFVSRKNCRWGDLNGADLGGGILGTILGTTIMIPLMGVIYTAGFLFVLKIFSGVIGRKWRN